MLINWIERIAYFFYDYDENDSRGTRPIETFLGEYQGTIQSDGYSVYKQLANENPLIEHLLCRAHVRAKFKLAADIAKTQKRHGLWNKSGGYI